MTESRALAKRICDVLRLHGRDVNPDWLSIVLEEHIAPMLAAKDAEEQAELARWKHGYSEIRRVFNGQCDSIGQIVKMLEPRDRRIDELEAAIRAHRDQHADDRCWIDDQKLYAALGDGNLGDNTVGDPEAMRKNCDRFIANRCQAGGNWPSYAELEQCIRDIDKTLRVPAAEYVPAIGDVFTIIDRTMKAKLSQ